MQAASGHAVRRMAQRAIGDEAVDAVVRWGIEIRQCQGRIAFFLGHRSAARALRLGEDVEGYVGTAVVLGDDGGLITAIRTRRPDRLRRRDRRAARPRLRRW